MTRASDTKAWCATGTVTGQRQQGRKAARTRMRQSHGSQGMLSVLADSRRYLHGGSIR